MIIINWLLFDVTQVRISKVACSLELEVPRQQ